MSCTFGNCNDANCVQGDTTDVNGNLCDDASCSPCGSVAVTGGVPASTVAPNPSIMAAGSSPTPLTAMTNTLGQWGATIASLATGNPLVVGPSGVRTGYAAAYSPTQIVSAQQPQQNQMMMLVIGIVVVAVVLLVVRK